MSIQFRRGTSTKRAEATEVLKAGQPFYETDTGKLYIGTGGALKNASTKLLSIGTTTYMEAGKTEIKSALDRAMQAASYTLPTSYSDPGKLTLTNSELKLSDTLKYSSEVTTTLYAGTFSTDINGKTCILNPVPNEEQLDISGSSESGLVYGAWSSPGYVVAGFGGGTVKAASATALGPGGLYSFSSGTKYKVAMPGKAGTIALTSDISELANVPTFDYDSTNKTLTITNVTVS